MKSKNKALKSKCVKRSCFFCFLDIGSDNRLSRLATHPLAWKGSLHSSKRFSSLPSLVHTTGSGSTTGLCSVGFRRYLTIVWNSVRLVLQWVAMPWRWHRATLKGFKECFCLSNRRPAWWCPAPARPSMTPMYVSSSKQQGSQDCQSQPCGTLASKVVLVHVEAGLTEGLLRQQARQQSQGRLQVGPCHLQHHTNLVWQLAKPQGAKLQL